LHCASASTPEWAELRNIERTAEGYRTTGPDPWLISEVIEPHLPAERCYLLIELSSSRRETMQVFWRGPGESFVEERSVRFEVPAGGRTAVRVVDLGQRGNFRNVEAIRFDPSQGAGLRFRIDRLELITLSEVPEEAWVSLLEFDCYTSKLHYRPGERIEYQMTMQSKSYPDRQSSKILEAKVYDEKGREVGAGVQHYGLLPMHQIRELRGGVEVPKPLSPGRYRIDVTSTDQRSGLALKASKTFGVQGEDDPFIYETPFKYINDFSLIQGKDGRWHVFGITGDLTPGMVWTQDGQARTFSHGSSADLRNWTYHKPVITISNDEHPDGNGRYGDRNVWAPHVIRHGDTYFMFYTSVNEFISQSISLATSKDLFEWEEYEGNPVFTLEGVEWAKWTRDEWSDCRDPVVLVDGDKFYLYVTGEASEFKDARDQGLIAVAESDDLIHWKNPEIAVRGHRAMESPQVWKEGGRYHMVTSAQGAGTFASEHPVRSWEKKEFPRAPVREAEKYVDAIDGRIEEIVWLEDRRMVMATGSFRNSVYFFEVETDGAGKPVRYKSPFRLP